MKQTRFYPNGVDEDVFWESEEEKLFSLIIGH
jgi:hypothetical protein